ncbi:hypothetical protein DYB25_000893 [Aphanomyces astaci]|uniref:PDEase domain-containing protein n=2 Tax=Aphanomyces astaci TaxID=112090 RepID=A0A397EEE7_APHAT|nr:hypothetical protein DYB25_000893 [Aphanomyces astaci]RHY82058.1 hypothetical protein DYB31_007261 [Aphanomyces astaci]
MEGAFARPSRRPSRASPRNTSAFKTDDRRSLHKANRTATRQSIRIPIEPHSSISRFDNSSARAGYHGQAAPPRPLSPSSTPPSPRNSALPDELKQWTFDPFAAAALSKDVLVGHVLTIFQAFSLPLHFRIGLSTLRRFVVAVRDQYRDVPYHNFLHEFTTLHVTFLVMLSQSVPEELALSSASTPLLSPATSPLGPVADLVGSGLLNRRDILALFIGAMCHHMNDNGSTNDFHIKSAPPRRCYTFRHGMFDKDKQLLLNAIVHNADIANPALATPLHARWSTSLMQEFNAQYEEVMNVGVGPMRT